jgi:hypothetical protein
MYDLTTVIMSVIVGMIVGIILGVVGHILFGVWMLNKAFRSGKVNPQDAMDLSQGLTDTFNENVKGIHVTLKGKDDECDSGTGK